MTQLLRSPIRYDTKTQEGIRSVVDALLIWSEQVSRVINNLASNMPVDSTASDVAGVVSDFNDLLDVIRGLSAR